jgi:Fe-S cluster biogenesis protein NfuA
VLVAVEQGTAYLKLSGGCQGCAMATVTLRQGIETTILQAVPEITSVVDVTDQRVGGTGVGLGCSARRSQARDGQRYEGGLDHERLKPERVGRGYDLD